MAATDSTAATTPNFPHGTPSAGYSVRSGIKAFLRTLPDLPGVYRMIGENDAVLYVGKAKSLKKRVSSYFRAHHPSPRTALMVAQIERVDITVTDSEAHALLLENNLIKELAPRYNILFRDDKSYPYIAITRDSHPRLAFYRGRPDKRADYFGPFPSAFAVRESIQLLQKTFRLRTCENPVFAHRSRPCLLYQIKRCSGPCVGLISPEDYAADVRLATLFLRGRHDEVLRKLGAAMETAAEKLAFEQAALLRDQILALHHVREKYYVDSGRGEDIDIVAAIAADGMLCVNLAMVRGGRHLGDRPQFPVQAGHPRAAPSASAMALPPGEETAAEISEAIQTEAAARETSSDDASATAAEALAAFLHQHYLAHTPPPHILVNIAPADDDIAGALSALAGRPVGIAIPRQGARRAWVERSAENARLAIAARRAALSLQGQRLTALAAALALESPQRIECFDISHTQGEATVASCVVYQSDGMRRSEYRRFNIRDIAPGDDPAAIRQAVQRRYEKIAEGISDGQGVAPDLILIDGGRTQVGAALAALEELGLAHLPLLGVAKGEGRKPGLETLIFPGGRAPLQLPAEHPALHLIQEIRDEAHRFAISGHRGQRAKARRVSRLEAIEGIGPKRRKALLTHFGGLQDIAAATIEQLAAVPGISYELAEKIHAALR